MLSANSAWSCAPLWRLTSWKSGAWFEKQKTKPRPKRGARASRYGARTQSNMEHRNVKSSMISRIGYDVAEKLLDVTFRANRTYRYSAVPKEIADGLLAAKSHGIYFAENVRDKFKYVCLNPPPPKEPDQTKESKSIEKKKAAQGRKRQPI